MESLRKAVEEKNEFTRNSISRSKELELKEEISLLKKENESLRNEIRRKDLVIESFQSDDTYASKESGRYGSFNPIPEPNFKIVKKKHACNESPKPT